MASRAPFTPDDKTSNIDHEYEDLFNRDGNDHGHPSKLSEAENLRQLEKLNQLRETNPEVQENLANLRNQEDQVGSKQPGGHISNVTGNKGTQKKLGLWQATKKRGPIGGIAVLLFVGIFGMLSFLTPGLLLVHVVETITDRMNMQFPSLDIRTNKVLTKKISNQALSGVCTTVKNIRCQFQSLNDRQLEALRKAGVTVNLQEGTTITGRHRVASMEFDGKPIDPGSLRNHLQENPRLRSAFKSAYNSKFAGFFDKKASEFYSRYKIGRAKPFSNGERTDAERTKTVQDVTKEGRAGGTSTNRYIVNDDGTVTDTETGQRATRDDGTPMTPEDAENYNNDMSEGASRLDENSKKIADSNQKSANRVLEAAKTLKEGDSLKGRVFGAVSITGFADNLCTLYGIAKAVAFGAKTVRAVQMMRFAGLFLTTASMIKAGDAEPEDVEYFATTLTKTVKKELEDDEGKITEVVTKAATDSYGYQYAAYGDTGPLTDSASQYLAGGGLGGDLSGVISKVTSLLGGRKAADKTCKTLRNPWVSGASVVVGVISLIGPGWILKLARTIGELGLEAYLTEKATTVLPALLQDIVAGVLVDDQTFGEAAGDALVSGSGAMMSSLAGMGGNAPLKPAQAVAYTETQAAVLAQYAEEDRLNHSPFDASNPNTFMGRVVSQLIPYAGKTSSITNMASTTMSVAKRSVSSILAPNTFAATVNDYKICEDPDYRDIDLATDPFCNPIRGIPPRFLDMDPIEIVDALIEDEDIDENSGAPKSEEYKKFIENCINRDRPLGDSGANLDESDGQECFIAEDYSEEARKKARWYIYQIDLRVLDGMENGYDLNPRCAPTSSSAGGSNPGKASAADIDAAIEASQRANPNNPHPLDGMGQTIIDLSNQYGVNSDFIAVTLHAETQFGTDGAGGPVHNNFGWNKYDPDVDECGGFYWGGYRYNCYNEPETGIEGILKNLTGNPLYRTTTDDPATGPTDATPGTIAAVRPHYCPAYDGCDLEGFIASGELIGIPISGDDPVFGDGAPSSSSSLSSAASSSGANTRATSSKLTEDQLRKNITEYGLPEPKQEGDRGYAALVNQIKENPDATWAVQSFLTGEKTAINKGIDVKPYLTTAWVWFETGIWPDPYEVNCQSNTEHPVHEICHINAGDLDKVQVAGYQAWDVQDRFTEIYNRLYSESDLEKILEEVIKNSSKASIDPWKYVEGDMEKIKGVTLDDIYPNKDFNDQRGQFLSFMLGKDPTMAAALNSFAVSEDDVIKHISGPGCGPGWAGYICDDEKQLISNMIMALYILDDGSASLDRSCASAASFTSGTGLGSIVEGNTDPENNFKAEWGNGLYKYGIGHGTNGSEHTGIDIGGERGAKVFTPVAGTVVCDKTIMGTECSSFRSYKVTQPGSDLPCPYHGEGTPEDGTGHIQIKLDNGDTLILGHTLTSVVQVGQRVQAGQQVGTVGCMNGHHIHVEYRIPDPVAGYMIVDPEKYLGR